jgi:hypothetical protein
MIKPTYIYNVYLLCVVVLCVAQYIIRFYIPFTKNTWKTAV